MQLRSNGPIINTYRWLYGLDRYDLTNNFCPIFWMIVLGAVLIIPYAIFCLPVVIYELVDKNYRNGDRSFAERIGISIFSYLGLFMAWSILEFVLYLFGYLTLKDRFVFPGMLFTIIGTGIGLAFMIRKYFISRSEKIRKLKYDAYENGETVPDTLCEVISNTWSAFYDKHCPRITWIDPKPPTTDNHDSDEDQVLDDVELTVHVDPILGTTYGLKNINNTDSEILKFPNLKS